MSLVTIILIAQASASAQVNLPPPPIVVPPPAPAPVPARIRGNPGTWVTNIDYPTIALRAEQDGVTTFRLIVDISGRVSNCEIIETSGWRALDQATCQSVQQRARFYPATDWRGEHVEGTYSGRVRWAIPHDELPLNASRTVRQFLVGEDGAESDCRETENGRTYLDMCSTIPYSSPYRDAKGMPVRKLVTVTTTVTVSDMK